MKKYILKSIIFVFVLSLLIPQKQILAACPDDTWTMLDPIPITVVVGSGAEAHNCYGAVYVCVKEENGIIEFYISEIMFMSSDCMLGFILNSASLALIETQIINSYFNSNNLPPCDDPQQTSTFISFNKAYCWQYHTFNGKVDYTCCDPSITGTCVDEYKICFDTYTWSVVITIISQSVGMMPNQCNIMGPYFPELNEGVCYTICE
jgi:hypothetical protein